MPKRKEELELYLINVDTEIERLKRMRDTGNDRPNESGELLRERERESEREIEKERVETRVRENPRLRNELESCKRHERESEIYFSRDERFEMFERTDGSLDCFKRDSTSLANRLGKKVELEPNHTGITYISVHALLMHCFLHKCLSKNHHKYLYVPMVV